jgi:MbtH protein
MARQLLADGERVSFLGLLDAPLLKGKADLPLAAATQAEALAMLADEIGLAPSVVPLESVTELFAAASAAGLVPPYLSAAQAERIAAVHFNTARIAASFEPAETLALPALQVRAMQSAKSRGGLESVPDWTCGNPRPRLHTSRHDRRRYRPASSGHCGRRPHCIGDKRWLTTRTTPPTGTGWCLFNDEGEHSLWPAVNGIPAGWRAVGPTGPKSVCLAYVEEHWTDMRPRSLRS